MKFEICVDSVAGVRSAVQAGADRVELCADLFEGGITPSLGMVQRARTVDGIGLHVMIRPRGGDFVFDGEDAVVMLADIEAVRGAGADGIVIGALTPNGSIDVPLTRKLIDAAGPLSVTFHRAFDMTAEPVRALEVLIELGVSRVLTSGQEATVLEGAPLIRKLIEQAGQRIIVMPGGGITARNAARIVEELQPQEMHFAALTATPSPSRWRNDHVFMGGELRAPEYSRMTTSAEVITAVMAATRS